MCTDAAQEDCFACEIAPEAEPSHGWNLMQLEEYAKAQHDAIVRSETTFAPAYQRLGRALELIRPKRGRGEWGKHLESLGTHRVRRIPYR